VTQSALDYVIWSLHVYLELNVIKGIIIIETFINISLVCTDKLVIFLMLQYNHNIDCAIHNIAPGNYCYYVSRKFVCLILPLVFQKPNWFLRWMK